MLLLPKHYDQEQLLNKGIDLYTLAVHKFMGNSIIKRLEGAPFSDLNDLHDRLKLTDSLGEGEWIDLSGLIVPKQAVKDEIDRIVGNPDSTLEETESSSKPCIGVTTTWNGHGFVR